MGGIDGEHGLLWEVRKRKIAKMKFCVSSPPSLDAVDANKLECLESVVPKFISDTNSWVDLSSHRVERASSALCFY